MNKRYYVIEKGAAGQDLRQYGFEELKNYFKPIKEELPESYEEWEQVQDLLDLEQFLKNEYDGMEVPYSFQEVE